MISRRRVILEGSAAALLMASPRLRAKAADDLLDRARALLKQAPLIDTHNDLPSMLLDDSDGDLKNIDLGKVQSSLCADVPRLREGCVGVQYWSVWVESATQKTHTAMHQALREFDVALRLIESQPAFEQARSVGDIRRIHGAGKIACLIGVEGGHMIENSLAALRIYFDLGARYMTLTHWDNIDWADASTDRPEHFGLTGFGKQVVREMNRLGMFVDLSHVSADVMRDALHVSRAPVLFSHSNAYAIDPHPRNVPDDVLTMVKANGGVVHVNFIKGFVAKGSMEWQARHDAALRECHARLHSDKAVDDAMNDWTRANPPPRGSIVEVADHIDHIRQVAGIDHIGIGADFYDVAPESMVAGLENVSRYPDLFAELLRRGYSDDDVLKIAGRNHLRAMAAMEKVAGELRQTETPIITKG